MTTGPMRKCVGTPAIHQAVRTHTTGTILPGKAPLRGKVKARGVRLLTKHKSSLGREPRTAGHKGLILLISRITTAG